MVCSRQYVVSWALFSSKDYYYCGLLAKENFVVGVVNGASHMLHFKHKLPKTASLVMLLVRRMHTSFTSQNRIPNLLDPRLFVRPKNTVATAKMVEAPPADMASSDSENMMEVEAPNNNSDGGAASGPPPRLMISKMVRFGPIMIRFDSSVEFTINSVLNDGPAMHCRDADGVESYILSPH